MATEAVVFKKKSRRNFRRKNFEDENEEEVAADEAAEQEKPVVKPEQKQKKTVPKTLLSFGHDEEDSTEVFKVKKSKESRRLSKQRVKAKKTKESEPEEKIESPRAEDVNDDKLESLREELSNLGGKDDDGGNDLAENDGDKVIQSDGIIFKPLRANPNKNTSFQIPDAAAIHAARKRREMARQMGTEIIPIDDTDRYSGRFENTDKSRLIREDDNDHSDEDPDQPLGFGTRKSNHPGMQRRLEVEKALAKESDEDEKSDEEDDALRRFEEEQIRKGVSIPQTQQEDDNTFQMYMTQQYLYGNTDVDPNYAQHGTSLPAYANYPPTSLNTVTMDMIWEKINNRIVSLQEVNRGRRLEKEKMTSQMESSDASITSLGKQLVDAEGRYGFFQEMRGYVRDLIECLNEKVPVIEDLESRMHSLLKQRADRFLERRQKDIQDQAEDFAAAQTGKSTQVKPEFDEFGRDKSAYVEQAKQRRAVEREARRNRRKKEREAATSKEEESKQYHEGFSSDDEEGSGDILRFKAESEKISDESKKIFEDVLEDFGNIKSIITRFQQWKYGFSETYKQAFVHLCLPKLVLPFVKIELLDWNPLMKECKDFEEMQWFEDVMFYGFKDNSYDPDDEDTNFIPRLAEKVLVPKLTALLGDIWDPLSLKQTVFAVNLIKRLVLDYPTISAEKRHTKELFNTVITRIKKCMNDDIYVPLYPKSLLEKKSIGAEAFVERQFWSCLKLLGNIFLWHGLISAPKLQELAVDGLLNRYLLLSLQHAAGKQYENVIKCQAIVSVLPHDWFEGSRRTTLDCLGSFSRYLESLAKSLKLKAEGSTAQEKKKARVAIKKVILMMVQIKSLDMAENFKIAL
ncbi:PAX3- and PAX7-binding protein 1-like [Dendronephthya gigantea]|uniref:PAX3- and PAX7-binding protein 1-like n=1 Tax=Dendronephthya gigantea TaxID=151771 RepID=UPI0010699784|nr:PAX3- and PAX7-binding protein 1-like [Dendronephthya gigantea]